MKLSCAMGLEFENWQKLTDEYAKELSAMQRGDPGARPRVMRLAREIQLLSPSSSDVLVSPKGQSGAFDEGRPDGFASK